MNQNLQAILNSIQQSTHLSDEEKSTLAKAVKDAEKEFAITEFKLDRTEKVKRTTAILLEETIAELEQKRKDVEAQNRDLEIEAALEKVRSRSLAMQKSDELADLSLELVKQVQALGVATWFCAFNIYNDNDSLEWGSNGQGAYEKYITPREGIFLRYYEAGKRGETLLINEIGENECPAHYDYLCSLPGVGDQLLQMKAAGIPFPASQIDHVAFHKYGYLLFITYEPVPEAYDIFKRFAKVFEQTYTRFLDLQKAEAQAREAQIELALERVRARTMAMQKSDELSDAAQLLFHQIEELGVNPWTSGFQLWDEDRKSVTVWTSTQGVLLPPFKVPATEESLMLHIVNAAEKGETLYVEEMGGEALEKHYGYMFSLPSVLELFGKLDTVGTTAPPTFQVNHAAFFSQGFLLIITLEPVPEVHDIFKRFAKVFEQTYTRFLDLQKAEAQAREAQIELGLERVRARAMAMQNSDELKELIGTVFIELTKLDLVLTRCLIMIYGGKANDSKWWMANSEDSENPNGFHVKHHTHPPIVAYFKAWRERELKWTYVLKGKIKKDWDVFLFNKTELKTLPDFVIAGMRSPDKVYLNASFNNFGNLTLASLEPLSDEHFDILLRFAKVFDLTYTRFNDLKNAEAQARESQIQLALERVRARTMAMQKSDELRETVQELNGQLQHLGFVSNACNIIIINKETGDCQYWVSGFTKDIFPVSYYVPYFEHPYYNALLQPWKHGEQYIVYEYTGELKKKFDQIFFTKTEFSNAPEEAKQAMGSLPAVTLSTAYFTNGALQVIGTEQITEEKGIILQRFAKVFEQTYTRFLDLQKAEAQAREAQIETALERVRSRSLGMQKSEELKEVIRVVFDQFVNLNIHVEHAGFIMDYKERDDLHIWLADRHPVPSEVTIPCFDSMPNNSIKEAKDNGRDSFKYILTFEEKNKFYRDLFKFIPDVPEDTLKYYLSCPGLAGSGVLLENIGLYIENFEGILYTDEENNTLMRFGKVFQQTYTRFLDLQKAEAQAREAQVETSLERVRSRSLAMHHTSELQEVINTAHKELLNLNIANDGGSFIAINKDIEKQLRCWGSGGTADTSEEVVLPLYEKPFCTNLINGIKNGPGFFTEEFSQQDKKDFFTYLFEHKPWSKLDAKQKKGTLSSPGGYTRSCCVSKHTSIFIINHLGERFSEADNEILKRFGKVFEQSYTRFLDLQKAEAQAREAQIEAALERVRSRSLAMHTTNELGEVVKVIVEKLQDLGVVLDANGVILCTYFHDSKDVLHWIVSPDFSMAGSYLLPYFDHPIFNAAWHSKENGDDYFSKAFSVKEKDSFFSYAFEHSDYKHFPEEFKQWVFQNDKHSLSFAWQKNSAILIPSHTGVLPTEADKAILIRFSKVFEQSYIRFLDLQKAEAQAREAQIELGLERVRARAMAMQNSDELKELIGTVYTELTKLDIALVRCLIWIMDNETLSSSLWMANAEAVSLPVSFYVPYHENPPYLAFLKAWKEKNPKWQYDLKGQVKKEWDEYVFRNTEMKYLPEPVKKGMQASERIILAGSFHNFGCLQTAGPELLKDEHYEILNRFAKVFDLTYTRFNDLQKAEAQAREAKIEASLERVRGKAMAMHSSKDLAETILVFYHEIELLSATPRRCGVGLLNKENHLVELSTTSTSEEGKPIEVIGKINLEGHPVLEGIYDNWIHQKEYHPVLLGNEIKEYYKLISPQISYPDYPNDVAQYGYFFYFPEGGVFAWTDKELPEDELKIYRRFTTVLSLTYKRYKGLKEAETQAREAQIEAALERVRSRTLAMQKSDELAETSAVLFQQLILLGIEPNRLYISIVKDDKGETEFWITDEDGSKVSMAYEDNLNNNSSFKKMFAGWKKQQKSLVIDIKGEELHEYFTYLNSIHVPFKGGMVQQRRLQYIAYFNKGFIGMASPDEQPEDTLQLLERFAGVFNLTFTRFNDLKVAEAHALQAEQDLVEIKAARKNAEEALTELKSTQSQLIQSEKMASLGELTAGIAHEIQNPLNFVNNFSEVSSELVDEMNEEITKGNLEDAKEIASDLKQNLEKINHHGKRAGEIVKGMLQHSRTSSGQKEPTDINALCDEYLRLAYHGLRAKDKSFNATMKTDFDETIGNINIIPQDIGRVILNLITNGFYAVNEKSKQNITGYEPIVDVSTKKEGNKVLIAVKDNGNGIPKNIVDKIFQPFFTTKPTGQGTGLGLSLSYDIVKAHGGELKLETLSAEAAAQAGKGGEGSEFIIKLPLNTEANEK